jgi:hypothetical protein
VDTVELKDANDTPLTKGDRIATATSARQAGYGLRQGQVVGITPNRAFIEVRLESGRVTYRRPNELVKVAT